MKASDPCRCRSGLIYGECHKAIMDAPKAKVIGVAQRIYATQWALNSDAYNQQGLYQTLAQELATQSGTTKVIDIGCGLGQGMLALRHCLGSQSLQLIGLDENPECLIGAAEQLGAPQPESNFHRIKNTVLPTKRIRIGYHDIEPQGAGPITLIQSDILVEDKRLRTWLKAQAPFDAVTQWFCGVHKARNDTEISKKLNINNDADHRCQVEEATLRLAADVLRPGGWVQIVMRGAFSSETDAVNEIARGYAPLLNSGPFVFHSAKAIRYDEPQVAGQIQVRSVDADINHLPGYAVSMLAKKLG